MEVLIGHVYDFGRFQMVLFSYESPWVFYRGPLNYLGNQLGIHHLLLLQILILLLFILKLVFDALP